MDHSKGLVNSGLISINLGTDQEGDHEQVIHMKPINQNMQGYFSNGKVNDLLSSQTPIPYSNVVNSNREMTTESQGENFAFDLSHLQEASISEQKNFEDYRSAIRSNPKTEAFPSPFSQ